VDYPEFERVGRIEVSLIYGTEDNTITTEIKQRILMEN
jgi:hypothetical protein